MQPTPDILGNPDAQRAARAPLRTSQYTSRIIGRLSNIVAALLFAGCAVQPPDETGTQDQPPVRYAPAQRTYDAEAWLTRSVPATIPDSDVDVAPDVAAEIDSDSAPYSTDLWDRLRANFTLETVHNPEVRAQIRFYSEQKKVVHGIFERGAPYLHWIVTEVEARGLPSELALLPAVESGFDPFAYSSSRASGLWQFIPSTGKRFGLRQDRWYDGRRDVVESTRAALDYLQALNARFDGDWMLAVAAYNGGEGTITRAIEHNRKRGRLADFWSLELREETRVYVPKLLAMAELVRHPERYGIVLPHIADEPRLVQVHASRQLDLSLAAEAAGVPLGRLQRLNAGLTKWVTPPDGPHSLLLPGDVAAELSLSRATANSGRRRDWHRHIVREGDTLNGISQRYGVSLISLLDLNDMADTGVRVGDELLIPGNAPGVPRATRRGGGAAPDTYIVKAGDTLWELAKRYGMTVKRIASVNGIKTNAVLKPGQRLALSAGGATHGRTASARAVHYVVQRGDSLFRISQRFKVSVADLQRWNDLGDNHRLQPGQRLKVFVNNNENTASG